MWLKFGVAPSGELAGIDEVVRGKTQLTCLYCGGFLTAKKGSVKEHHFAHTLETCKFVSQRIKTKAFPSLPLYDNFNVQLPGQELEQLKVLWKEYGAQDYAIPKDLVNFRWQLKGLLESEGDRIYQFTHLGKIPVGALPLALFNRVQEPLLLSELMKLEGSVEIALSAGLSCLEERRADLQIYRSQLRRILVNSLYFLEVKADGNCFYKIGVTTRQIEERITEVQRDVRAHYSDVAVNLLGLWEHRGNVELYFKHRYKAFNYRIGKLTEYFAFPDVKVVLNDLYGMEPKMLSDVELDAIAGC
ncbi:MAG: GIY-YIG nuclease family protein [Microcoleus sp. PH2017_25_DOB_D_A]|nr:GIY-YIG nuclease family protein [Microcoleus sp. PH2017_15_JOR_U_A]MCC3509491.1 GIY-YIG nuclease family protein [Microcoleus sp. PH2017_17_BER_D_A]MCC3535543.1 GIY-YIG nuclease family protein [Microcoleus sp. PH2017_25_DOB_D_A]MCC3545489.1 GIY-YIG nuclease family protein [Microcoleus sp. PH2017_24_DOB_U_A]TAE40447.1 MAG: GIY-YIG nuclease family protein [Oscillatoriales cyanobacterium]MCC3499422.1 GIY-YIG nuclease family protein [Microcoleus sp. PH2017_15_JOR_U_A]